MPDEMDTEALVELASRVLTEYLDASPAELILQQMRTKRWTPERFAKLFDETPLHLTTVVMAEGCPVDRLLIEGLPRAFDKILRTFSPAGRESPFPLVQFSGVPSLAELPGVLSSAPCIFGVEDPKHVQPIRDLQLPHCHWRRCLLADTEPLWQHIIHATLPSSDSSEASLQLLIASLVDQLARKSPDVKISRNLKTLSSGPPAGYDCAIYVLGVPLVVGEEKRVSDSKGAASSELTSKCTRDYGAVPFIFGFSVKRLTVTLWAFPPGPDEKLRLAAFSLGELAGRAKLVVALWRIISLCQLLAPLAPVHNTEKARRNGVKITFEGNSVIKSYRVEDVNRARHTARVLAILANVPGVIELKAFHEQAKCRPRLVLEPVGRTGDTVRPAARLAALPQLLRTLQAVHERGIVHRDLRWENVVHVPETGAWVLNDFDDASILHDGPLQSAPLRHFSREEHAPEIFSQPVHDHRVDVWAMGRMILALHPSDPLAAVAQAATHVDPDQRPPLTRLLAAAEALEEPPAKRRRQGSPGTRDRNAVIPT